MNERQIYVETWYLILSGSPDLPNVLNPFQFFFLERYLKNYHWKNVDENLRYYISNDSLRFRLLSESKLVNTYKTHKVIPPVNHNFKLF